MTSPYLAALPLRPRRLAIDAPAGLSDVTTRPNLSTATSNEKRPVMVAVAAKAENDFARETAFAHGATAGL